MWRILKNMSTNLTATIKTRFGPTRQIVRENGGRQGSRLTGRLFAKQMDTLSEKFLNNEIEGAVRIDEDFLMECLEWVDDVLSMTQGIERAKTILTSLPKPTSLSGDGQVQSDGNRKEDKCFGRMATRQPGHWKRLVIHHPFKLPPGGF